MTIKKVLEDKQKELVINPNNIQTDLQKMKQTLKGEGVMMYDKNWNYVFTIMNGIKMTCMQYNEDKSPVQNTDFSLKNTIEMN